MQKAIFKLRKVAILTTTLAVAVSVLVVSPAHATPSNGTYLCTTGVASSSTPNFTITNGVVSAGGTCSSSVVIPAGVTSIGVQAFYYASSLTSITIPSSVTTIEMFAFQNASSLTSITIPAGVTTIESGTFSGASALTSITIPAGVTSIGDYAFSGSGIVSITIPAGVTSIGTNAFENTAALGTITVESTNNNYRSIAGVLFNKLSTTLINYPAGMSGPSYSTPSSVTSIQSHAFGNSRLVSITIAAGVTSIGNFAFAYANSLSSVYFLGNAPAVGTNAFLYVVAEASAFVMSSSTGFANVGQTWNGLIVKANASNGTYLCTTGVASSSTPNFTITNGVVTDGSSCTGAVVIPSSVTSIGTNTFSNSGITSITIPAGVTSIGNSAFENASSLSSITIPAGVTSIGTNAFARMAALSTITVESTNNNYRSIDGVLFNKLSTTLISYPAGMSGTSYSTPSSVTSINEWAFAFASSLTTITIPSGTTSIGNYAFYSASSLTSITIPASVTNIGNFSFANATALTSIYFLGNAPATIGSDTFTYVATGAKAYIISSATGFATSGTPPLWNGLTVAIYVAPIETYLCTTGMRSSSTPNFTITDGVVSEGSSCTGTVVIPSGVTSIGSRAFQNATALTSITIPAGVTSIGDRAFQNASALTSITIPAGVTSIGVAVFYNTTALTSITIPAGVTSIGDYAFNSATALASITIPASVTSIGDRAFQNASALTSITIPAGVTSIGVAVFYNASALTSITIPAGVTSIGDYAFNSATALASITIPAGVTSIGRFAFFDTKSLTSVYFLGSAPTVGTTPFLNAASGAKAYVTSTASGFSKAGTTWNGLTVATHAPNGTYLCTTGMPSSSTPNFTITNNVVSAGTSCAGSTVIPDGVTSIGENAFYNARALTSITFGAGSALVSIGKGAYSGATSLSSITVGAVTFNIAAPLSVRFNKVSTTSARATAITGGIYFPATLTSIGDYAFSGATSITSITIPAGVTSIGEYAFSGATALRSFYFLGNRPTVGANAFSNVASGAKVYITSGATGFETSGTSGPLNGLTVEVVIDASTPVVNTPALVVQNSATSRAAADLAARTIGRKKSFAAKTLAKRVGIRIVSKQATVSLSVSKTSNKICAFSRSNLSTLKAGKCIVTFTVQEPTPKKGKKPKAQKTVKTLIVK